MDAVRRSLEIGVICQASNAMSFAFPSSFGRNGPEGTPYERAVIDVDPFVKISRMEPSKNI